MKLSIFNPILNNLSLEEMLATLNKMGVTSLELGVGGYPGTAHINAKDIIKSQSEIDELKSLLAKYNIAICAISVHGNALHPNETVAQSYHEDYVAACILAGKMGVDTVITFSGCPGDSEGAKYPNWVVCPWPEDFLTILDYQWAKLISYWKGAADIARDNNVKYIALEMHPGFCVYNPSTLLRLREAVGDIIGANFDPSHLIWQSIDPVSAIRSLRGAIYHFHAKDTAINPDICRVNGVLDTRHYSDEFNRSWIFRTVGYGSSVELWKNMISTLQTIGYNRAVSIEHEDSLMMPMEGLTKAVKFLREILIDQDKPSSINWA